MSNDSLKMRRFDVWHIGKLMIIRANSRLAPSQWDTSLQSNAVSHWLGAKLESPLIMYGLEGQIVYALTRTDANKYQNVTLASAEIVHHTSKYIMVFLIWHSEVINDDEKTISDSVSHVLCLCSVYDGANDWPIWNQTGHLWPEQVKLFLLYTEPKKKLTSISTGNLIIVKSA